MEGAFGCSGITSLCDNCDHKCERYEGYNQALENVLSKIKSNHYLLSDKVNSTDYGMFTCGIEQAIDELKR